jgi:hypothetical protein
MLNYPCGAVGDPNAPYNQVEYESVTITASLTTENGRKLTDEEIVEELIVALMNYREGKKSQVNVTIEETE